MDVIQAEKRFQEFQRLRACGELDETEFRVQVAKRWAIVFEAINITDEPFTAYEGSSDWIRQQEYYSWWATLGVRFDL